MLFMKRVFFIPVFIALSVFCCRLARAEESYLSQLQGRARDLRLARDPHWTRLLHMRRNIFGVYQSEVDDTKFFFSPRGRKDAAAELEATLQAFFVAASTLAPISPTENR